VLATAAAGPLVELYAHNIHGAEHRLMVEWAYFFIPQIFFYGMSSLIGAILNTRGRFAAPMWTPVINNLVVIVVGGLYLVAEGKGRTVSGPSGISRCSLRCGRPGSAGGSRWGSSGPRSPRWAGWPAGCWSMWSPSGPAT
jgi:hypothetical protein